MAAHPNEPAIGIDLGTTDSSSVGIFQNGKVEIIANDQDNRTTPSYVAFNETERLIDDPASAQVALNPENTVFGSKRLIGRTFDDPKLQDDLKHLPFTVIDDNNTPETMVTYKGEEKVFNSEDISAMVLTKMREAAEAYLSQKITVACITVPAYFNDSQRQATKDASTIVGLQVPKMLNEPTAAALAYARIWNSQTFDVLATAGDTLPEGDDFDGRLVDYFIDEIYSASSARTFPTRRAPIEIDALFDGTDFYTKITRARFEELCLDLFKSLLGPIQRALDDSKTDKMKVLANGRVLRLRGRGLGGRMDVVLVIRRLRDDL
ncbi:hypothetical protein MTO96_026564 [Rhipicephalus appendiculatus]